MIGLEGPAGALHELVEVAQRVLLGLRARVISRGDQHGVGRSAVILSILFPPLHGGASVLIPVLGLALAPTFVGAQRERRLLGVLDKGPRSWAIRARIPVATACVLVWSEPREYRRLVQSSR